MLFSVVIPTYNRAEFIITTLQSVLLQTYPDYEIIVVDDGSTDNTESRIRLLNHSRVRYFKRPNQERASSRNFGAQMSMGDYITFFDSDDILLPIHLEEAKKLVDRENKPHWFHLGYKITDPEAGLMKTVNHLNGNVNMLLLRGNFLSCNGVFLRKDIAHRHPFNTIRALSASEDHELWLRLAARYPLKYSNVVTSVIVNHDNRSVMAHNKDALIRRQEIFLESVLADEAISRFALNKINLIRASSCSYISLHLALTGTFKKLSLIYLIRAILSDSSTLFTRRFFAIIKHVFFKYPHVRN